MCPYLLVCFNLGGISTGISYSVYIYSWIARSCHNNIDLLFQIRLQRLCWSCVLINPLRAAQCFNVLCPLSVRCLNGPLSSLLVGWHLCIALTKRHYSLMHYAALKELNVIVRCRPIAVWWSEWYHLVIFKGVPPWLRACRLVAGSWTNYPLLTYWVSPASHLDLRQCVTCPQ